MEPPVSEPSASGTSLAATAAPDPALEPPGTRSRSQGLRAGPKALFSPDERVEMIRETIRDLEPRARVDKFSGLSVDYAQRIGAHIIIRSLRAVTDFDYELQMAHMNNQMWPQVETVFLFANPKLFFSASRLIKEVASYGKRLPELVPELVMNRLRAKLKID